ncbi:MAG: YegS/Rv2252/BmrU family lipid kinase, partial [Opitutus sp.]
MKLRFILNPRSGRNRRRPWLAPHIRKFIADHQLDATLVTTARAGHATSLAQAAVREGCDRVIAVGGDGTMNEVAQALLHSSTALGLVPCGSGNGLALHLGIPTRLDEALGLAAASSAVIAAIDTGSANGHPFFNAMGSGFDADISERFNHLERRGLPAYARTGFAAFRERRTRRVTIQSGARRHELDSLLIAVANSDQYGNHAIVAPGARVDDGELDLIAVAPVSILSALPLMARLFTGRLLGSPHITRFRGARFTIERDQPGLIHTDGETHRTSAKVEVVVHSRSLHVVLPASTTLAPSNLLRCHRTRASRPLSILPAPLPTYASPAASRQTTQPTRT